MKIYFSVSNLRRIQNIPLVELRPITIFVGRNSAGKSTLLRTFPLIKQSLSTKTSAPVLWFGDYVDFGDFQTAVSGGDQSKDIGFKFRIENINEEVSFRKNRFRRQIGLLKENFDIEYRIFQQSDKTKLRLIKVDFPELNETIEVIVSAIEGVPRVEVSGQIVFEEAKSKIFVDGDSLFSTPVIREEIKIDKHIRFRGISFVQFFEKELKVFLKSQVSKSIGTQTLSYEADKILRSSRFSDHILKNLSDTSSTKAFKTFYLSLLSTEMQATRKKIEMIKVAYLAFIALQFSEDELSQIYGAVQYLGPARARSERYYRRQELEVSEILPDGQNFPMFLASLSSSQQRGFSEWVESIFGYGIKIKNSSGHTSIHLIVGDQTVNVTDTGYGVSQLLPVLGQIWWSSTRSRPYGPSFGLPRKTISPIAIEQPELHLHPAHQALLADVFTRAIGEDKRTGLRFLIETHSESFLNKLGSLVHSGRLKTSDVQIVVFESDKEIEGYSTARIAQYNEKGILENWPYGFFDYNDDFQF